MQNFWPGTLGRAKGQAEPNRRTLENVCAFVEPVARDKASQLNIQGTINGDVIVNMHLTPVEANAVQNSARRALRPVRETIRGRHNRALLYLHQARNDPKSSVGDRGIIESIYPGPVRLVFADDGIKAQILESSENPFRVAYVVDVEVGTVNGRPLIYTVLELHDVIERPEAA